MHCSPSARGLRSRCCARAPTSWKPATRSPSTSMREPTGRRWFAASNAACPTLERIYEQYAKSNAAVAASAGEPLALEWTQIGRDLERYRSGDPVSAISALSGMVRAYADNPVEACAAERSTHAGVRDDYAARALARYAADRARMCDALRLAETRQVYDALASFYEMHLVSLWPFAASPGAPEVGTAELSTFVERVRAGADALSQSRRTLQRALRRDREVLDRRESDPIAVEFRLEWRARRAEELNARHIIDFAVGRTRTGRGRGLHLALRRPVRSPAPPGEGLSVSLCRCGRCVGTRAAGRVSRQRRPHPGALRSGPPRNVVLRRASSSTRTARDTICASVPGSSVATAWRFAPRRFPLALPVDTAKRAAIGCARSISRRRRSSCSDSSRRRAATGFVCSTRRRLRAGPCRTRRPMHP